MKQKRLPYIDNSEIHLLDLDVSTESRYQSLCGKKMHTMRAGEFVEVTCGYCSRYTGSLPPWPSDNPDISYKYLALCQGEWKT